MSRQTGKPSARTSRISGLARLAGFASLAPIQRKCGVCKSVFYRVVKGERTSARVERIIAREIRRALKDLESLGSKGG